MTMYKSFLAHCKFENMKNIVERGNHSALTVRPQTIGYAKKDPIPKSSQIYPTPYYLQQTPYNFLGSRQRNRAGHPLFQNLVNKRFFLRSENCKTWAFRLCFLTSSGGKEGASSGKSIFHILSGIQHVVRKMLRKSRVGLRNVFRAKRRSAILHRTYCVRGIPVRTEGGRGLVGGSRPGREGEWGLTPLSRPDETVL